ARDVYNQIRRQGRVVRGSIGISFRRAETQNEVILRSFGADYGVLVDEVQPGGPADRAGLQRGDVITAVNGETVRSGDELVEIITATAVGESVTARYLRDKKEREVTVSVEDRCKVFPEQCRESRAAVETERGGGRLGIRVEQPSASQLRNWGLDPDEDRGVLVREVDPNGFAEEVGLERGDLILEINQQRVRTLREFNETERRLGSGSDVVFGIKRPAQARWLWIYLGGTLP
ncbi:MAG: PDZ domain-containing protein, partial [Acidobacteria bacterium]|nr:PDZ domain-containing protein [Acidobacteriota bacterium]